MQPRTVWTATPGINPGPTPRVDNAGVPPRGTISSLPRRSAGGPPGLATTASGESPPLTLTGVGKNEIIATNQPRHPWIPVYAGMTEWA